MALACQNRVSKFIPINTSFQTIPSILLAMDRFMEEPNIKDPNMFHTHSYMLLLDGIMWSIISMMIIICLYVTSWIYVSEVIVLKVQVMVYFIELLLLLFITIMLLILLDLLRHGSLGFIKFQMVLALEAFVDIFRIWYKLMNEIYTKIFILYNGNIIILYNGNLLFCVAQNRI
eukprot:284854_1